jgi:hypothetical protein
MIPVLKSNSAEIPFNEEYFAELVPTPWRNLSWQDFRRIFVSQGYLFLKGYLDRDEVLAIRQKYFSHFSPSLFKPGTLPGQGLFSGAIPPELPPHGAVGHPAYAFVRSEDFKRFVDSEPIRLLAECLLQQPTTRLRRTPLRHFIRDRNVASRAHIDFTYLDAGSPDLLTAWVPIGDCPLRSGGLIYLEDSQRIDVATLRSLLTNDRSNDQRPLTHELRQLSDLTGRRWLWADFDAGDLVLHSPFIIHASVNSETDLMRVSVDIRYRPREAPADARWADDWSATDGF